MTTLLATMMLLVTGFIFPACSTDDPEPTISPDSEKKELSFDINSQQFTRATTFDNAIALQNEGSFICSAYDANTTTVNSVANISGTTVNWNSTNSSWEFNGGSRYWPASGSLDFFAYMPATLPSYITVGPNYSAEHDVTFTCTSLPMTHATQGNELKELVYAMALGQDKAGTNAITQPTPGQVALTFQHPFSRIKLQLSSTQAAIHINTITLKSIHNNGSYSHTGGWTPSGDANFVATLDADFSANDDIGTFIMIPQGWAGEIEVEAVWNVWGESKTNTVTATVPTTWVAGRSYTYTFNITETDLVVNTSKYTEQW